MSAVCEIDLVPVDAIVAKFAETTEEGRQKISPGVLIPLLQQIQDHYGYLPVPVLAYLSERTGIPASRIYGVATFYAQFYLEPHGKHTVTLCRGTSCHVRGGKKILGTIQSLLGIEDGETTEDGLFSLETVACLGACALSPVIVVGGKYYGKLTPRGAERILRQIMREEGC